MSLSAGWQQDTSVTHASWNSLLLKLAQLRSTQCAKHDTMWRKSILSLTSHSSAELGVYVITISNVAQLISELRFFHPDPKTNKQKKHPRKTSCTIAPNYTLCRYSHTDMGKRKSFPKLRERVDSRNRTKTEGFF